MIPAFLLKSDIMSNIPVISSLTSSSSSSATKCRGLILVRFDLFCLDTVAGLWESGPVTPLTFPPAVVLFDDTLCPLARAFFKNSPGVLAELASAA